MERTEWDEKMGVDTEVRQEAGEVSERKEERSVSKVGGHIEPKDS